MSLKNLFDTFDTLDKFVKQIYPQFDDEQNIETNYDYEDIFVIHVQNINKWIGNFY
jgi:hypothetical protein